MVQSEGGTPSLHQCWLHSPSRNSWMAHTAEEKTDESTCRCVTAAQLPSQFPVSPAWHLLGSRSAVWHVAGQNLKLVHPRFQVQLHSDHWGVRERQRVKGVKERRLTNGSRYGPYLQVSAVCLLDWPRPPNWPEFQLCRYQCRKDLQQLQYEHHVTIT